jgi:pimeloyl-ACP methyl ester carboxylesterase
MTQTISRLSRRFVLAATGSLLLVSLVTAQAVPPSPRLTPAQWQEDLAFLATVIRTRHARPFAHQPASDFDARVSALSTELPASADDTVRALKLATLAASIGDGHTSLQVYATLPELPLRWYWFEGRLLVTGAPAAHRRWLGQEVVRIGRLSTADAAARVAVLIPRHESPTFVLNWSQYLLRMPAVLQALAISPSGSDLEVTFRDDRGMESRQVLPAVPPGTLSGTTLERPYAVPPLARSRPGEGFWFARVPDSALLYFNFSDYPERTKMRATAEQLKAALSAGDVRALLVDMRENGGGDFKMGRLLIDMLREPIATHGISVMVAIGRGTFSAGMTNATDFKKAFSAPYLGEVSGARPNGCQENDSFELPNSRIRGSVAKTHYAFQDEDTAGLIPDVALPPTWADFKAGRDPALDWALTRMRQQAPVPRLLPDDSRPAPELRLEASTLAIQSSILDEPRRVFVATPASFARTTRRYPVLVVLDGEHQFAQAATVARLLAADGHIPEAIVVGIENVDRVRDYSPPGLPVSGNDGKGRADRFLLFLAQELLPALARDYRAGELVVLVGHSSGGVLACYAAATRPDLFRWSVALDAPTHLGDGWLRAQLLERAQRRPTPALRLVSIESRFGWTDETWQALRAAAPSTWWLLRERLAGESHESMAVPATFAGLKAIFHDFSAVTGEGVTPVERVAAFDRLSAAYGDIPPPRSLLALLVEDQIGERDIVAARGTLDRLIAGYGPPPNVTAIRARLDAAAAKPLTGPTVQELLAAPRPRPADVAGVLGEWRGYTVAEGSTLQRPVAMTLRVDDGVPGGEFTFPGGARHAIDYMAVVPGGLHVGYMNRMRPRGMLMYEGTIRDGVFEGRFELRGVVFVLPDGRSLPVTRFRLERRQRPVH